MTPLESAVHEAVAALFDAHGPMSAPAAHAALWPAVRDAVAALAPAPEPAPPAAPLRDRRARRWSYVVRFWDAAGELAGETDPETMEGTGAVPDILASLAAQMHGHVPAELHPDATRPRLAQLRNNLGRGSRAVLRIPYADGAGGACACQMDVYRLEG